MPNRSVNISVRMSSDQADALSAAQIADATTPSEKICALVDELERRETARGDFAAAAQEIEEMLAPSRRAVRSALGAGRTSDVLAVLFERLPDITARLVTAKRRLEDGESVDRVEHDAISDITAVLAEWQHISTADEPRALDPGGLARALGVKE